MFSGKNEHKANLLSEWKLFWFTTCVNLPVILDPPSLHFLRFRFKDDIISLHWQNVELTSV
jgi:hypothetical protein